MYINISISITRLYTYTLVLHVYIHTCTISITCTCIYTYTLVLHVYIHTCTCICKPLVLHVHYIQFRTGQYFNISCTLQYYCIAVIVLHDFLLPILSQWLIAIKQ